MHLYPQQSVSKLWVSITALDAVDRGRVSLDDKVTLTRDDLTLFHQPIADEVLKDGAFTTSLDDLLTRAITTSDNTANDKLMRSVGGPAAVRAMIIAQASRVDPLRQWRTVDAEPDRGLSWSQDYCDWTGNSSRSATSFRSRCEARRSTATSPILTTALHRPRSSARSARLKRGELLRRNRRRICST